MNENSAANEKSTLQFAGTGGEYFKIWIVNILLSLITLGIYSAWAKVRSKRYFYGNTLLNDTPFEYHATPKQILIGRSIALLFFIIYVVSSRVAPSISGILVIVLLIITPWIIYRSIRFNARVSSYRNVRFNFNGTAWSFYKYLYLYAILPALVFGLAAAALHFVGIPRQVVTGQVAIGVLIFFATYPWVQRNVTEYVNNKYTYGQGQFSTSPALSTGRYYLIYLIAFVLLLLVVALVATLGYVLGLFSVDLSSLTQFRNSEEVDPQSLTQLGPMLALFYAAFFMAGFVFKAYIQASIRKHVFARTKLDKIVSLSSTVTMTKLFWLFFSNFLLLIFTLGMAYPWIAVRMARYFAKNSQVLTSDDLSHYVSVQQDKQSALGEELGEVFDVDMNLGL